MKTIIFRKITDIICNVAHKYNILPHHIEVRIKLDEVSTYKKDPKGGWILINNEGSVIEFLEKFF